MIEVVLSEKKKHKKAKYTADLPTVLEELSQGKFPKYDRTETLRDFSKCRSFEEGARSIIITMIRLKGAPVDDLDLIKKYQLSILQKILES